MRQGAQSIGPTAPLTVIVVALLTGIGLILTTKRRMNKSYFALSIFVLVMASVSVYRTFTDAPLWWLSDFWRYLGAVVNGVGIVGFIVLVNAHFNKSHDTESLPLVDN